MQIERRPRALGAVRYGGTQTFSRSRSRTLDAFTPIDVAANVKPRFRYGQVQPDQVVGVFLDVYTFVRDQTVPQQALDQVFRTMFAQLGYDVGTSQLTFEAITFEWKVVDGNWEAVVSKGPADVVGAQGFLVLFDAPQKADNNKLPNQVEVYRLIARPKDLIWNSAKEKALSEALVQAQAQVMRNSNTPNAKFGEVALPAVFPMVTVRGIQSPVAPTPPKEEKTAGGIGMWMALIGVGYTAILAMRGKTNAAAASVLMPW